jgi:hypothetical protein
VEKEPLPYPTGAAVTGNWLVDRLTELEVVVILVQPRENAYQPEAQISMLRVLASDHSLANGQCSRTIDTQLQTEEAVSKKLAELKSRLAAKYERLARVAKSQPKKKAFLHKAESYRRQAEQAARE